MAFYGGYFTMALLAAIFVNRDSYKKGILQGLILDIGGKGYTDMTILSVPEVNFSFVLPALRFLVIGYYGL